jgi:PKD repeat protein
MSRTFNHSEEASSVNNPTVDAGPDMTCQVNQLCSFSGTSSHPEGKPMYYTWFFGDTGSISYDLAPTYTFTKAGTYLVVLTVIDENNIGTGADWLLVTVEGTGGNGGGSPDVVPELLNLSVTSVSLNDAPPKASFFVRNRGDAVVDNTRFSITLKDPNGNTFCYMDNHTLGTDTGGSSLYPYTTDPNANHPYSEYYVHELTLNLCPAFTVTGTYDYLVTLDYANEIEESNENNNEIFATFLVEGGETCFDSDGGQDFFTKGYVLNNSVEQWDWCAVDGYTVIEYYCDDTTDEIRETYSVCPTGHACSDGACTLEVKEWMTEYYPLSIYRGTIAEVKVDSTNLYTYGEDFTITITDYPNGTVVVPGKVNMHIAADATVPTWFKILVKDSAPLGKQTFTFEIKDEEGNVLEIDVITIEIKDITKNYIFIARHDVMVDFAITEAYAEVNNAPVYMIDSETMDADTKRSIEDLIGEKDLDKIIIVGGTEAVSSGIQTDLEGLEITVQRIGGSDRFETAALFATEIWETANKTLLTNGDYEFTYMQAYPHAVTIKGPMLLTRAPVLNSFAKTALTTLGTESATTYGTDGDVSDAVVTAVQGMGITTIRITE